MTIAAWIIAAYLLGSVPFGLLLGRLRGVDIRRSGSKNIGATNLARALGRRWGILAFVLDFSKGLLPTLLALLWSLGQPATLPGWAPVATGAGAVMGHVYPLYLRFRGGKGVATAFGVMAALSWTATLAAAGIWAVVYLSTRTVSVASMAAALCLPLGVAVLPASTTAKCYGAVLGFSVALALLILLRHRANLLRLARGEELRFR